MSAKILVIGATGNVGSRLVKTLVARGEQVRAASRNPKPVDGAESIQIDLNDPSTLAPAFDGIDRAYLILPPGELNPVALAKPVIEEAARRKVKIVLQTAIGVDADDNIPLRQVELLLQASGVPFVILRPNWFSDNFATYWGHDVANGTIAVPAGDGRTSFIDARDIAESAAGALTSNAFDGQAFNLTGPEALSYSEAAVVLSKAYGKTIGYRSIDDAAFIAKLSPVVGEGYAQLLAAIFHPVREGWTAAVTDSVERLSGHAPRSLEQWARENAPVNA
jgi:uncharacterized protein YbjT (DUF2867 family)